MRSADTTIDFDIDLAKSQSDKNPVFYVQYAHARACSIIRKALENRVDVDNKTELKPLLTQAEVDDFNKNPNILAHSVTLDILSISSLKYFPHIYSYFTHLSVYII